MTTTIKISDELIREARRYGKVYSRSAPKQIECWTRIGKIAEENPDLPYSFVKNILLSLQDLKDQQITPYTFG